MSTTPFAALVCFMALGIACGRYINSDVPLCIAGLCCLCGAAAMIVPALLRNKSRRILAAYSLRNSIWLVVLPVMFMAGIVLLRGTQADYERISSHPYARGVIKERVITTNGEQMVVEVSSLMSDTGRKSSVTPFDVMLYTGATDFDIGDDIVFKANFQPANSASSGAQYMYAKGIDYTSSTDSSKIRRLGEKRSLTAEARHWRDAIVIEIENSSLSRNSKAFAAALLLGDREGLQPEVRDDFAGAGIAHVLALSGLHIGIILMILGWITKPLNLCGLRNLRFLLIAVAVALFALLTGLSAPVERAALMALCMLMAKWLQRKYSGVNVLCLAACLILSVCPRALFDVGFQLSFAGALAIISVMPALVMHESSTLRRKFSGLLAVPVSVFLMTWPLVAWHFHSLPLLFLPLNLALVPLLPVYMVLLVIFVALLMIGVDLHLLASLLDTLNELMARSALWISDIPGARAEIFPHWIIALAGVAAMLTTAYYLKSPSRQSLAVALSAVLSLCVSAIFCPSAMPPDKLVIPPNYASMQVISQESGRITTSDLVDGAYTRLTLSRGNILYADAPLERLTSCADVTADILIIGHNFHGELDSLLNLCKPELVVLSARAYEQLDLKVEQCTANRALPLHRLRDNPLEFVY